MSLIRKINYNKKFNKKCFNFTTPSHSQGDFVCPDAEKILGRKFYECDYSETEGFDALTNSYVDMFEAGIVDPAKVTRSVLENAVSVASMLLTTEAAVVDVPAKDNAPAMPPMGGMGGMM